MSIGQCFVLCVWSGATIFPKNPPWSQNFVLNKKLSRDVFLQLRFRTPTDANAQKCTSVYISELRVFLMKNSLLFRTTDILSAAASFCARKNSPSRVYKEVHPWENPLKQVWFLERFPWADESGVWKQCRNSLKQVWILDSARGKAWWGIDLKRCFRKPLVKRGRSLKSGFWALFGDLRFCQKAVKTYAFILSHLL